MTKRISKDAEFALTVIVMTVLLLAVILSLGAAVWQYRQDDPVRDAATNAAASGHFWLGCVFAALAVVAMVMVIAVQRHNTYTVLAAPYRAMKRWQREALATTSRR